MNKISGRPSSLLLKLTIVACIVSSTICQTAILFGASGTVGSEVLHALAKQEFFKQVTIIGRNHEKVESILAEMNSNEISTVFKNVQVSNLSNIDGNEDLDELKADACFITVGVAHPYKLNLQSWYSIEVDMVASIARFCNKCQVQYIALLSAISTEGYTEKDPEPFSSSELDEKSPLGWWGMLKFYDRLKKLEEKAVINSATKTPLISLFQPSTIVTNEYRYGSVDRTLFVLHKFLDPVIPTRYHSVDVKLLGMSMVGDAVQKLSSKSPPNAYCSVLKKNHGGIMKVFRLTYKDYLSITAINFERDGNGGEL